uniref:Uncharacterized protein n=1 Tax=Noctiluca scintillans TaxID=2966 RepID=A0A7S1F3D8_NOCSC
MAQAVSAHHCRQACDIARNVFQLRRHNPMSKAVYIGGAWASVCGIGGYKAYRFCSQFEVQTPGARDALHRVSDSPVARGVFGEGLRVVTGTQRRSIDTAAGLTCASFSVQGDKTRGEVFFEARKAQGRDIDDDDDEKEQGTLRYYWSRPWELKLRLFAMFRRSDLHAQAERLRDWEVSTLYFLADSQPTVLIGDVRCVPESEARLGRDVAAKSDTSRQRLQLFVGLVAGGAVMTGGLQVFRSISLTRKHQFVKQAVVPHPRVVAAVGPGATIQSIVGTFEKQYVDAHMRLVGRSGTLADVDITATRGASTSWRVLAAKMRSGGRQTHLDF